MRKIFDHKPSKKAQYFISLLLVILTSSLAFIANGIFSYISLALILLLVVSLLAIVFDILPVLLAAVLSALILNFFFIPPLYTFHITNTEDLLLFSMYFIIALVNAVFTYRIRKEEHKVREKEEKENEIKLYNTLLNSLSHELRTPIAAILGAVDTIKENKLNAKQQAELLSEIDTASVRLNQHVENLLNMNRLENGMLRLKLDWCDINELIFSVTRKFDFNIKKNTLNFCENEAIPLVKLDSGLIEHALYNILSNAIIYTPDYSTISINLKFENSKLEISIADDGDGFPESEIPYLFEKFYRLPNAKVGGTGLGLSIAKGYIEAHKGTITAERNLPSGAKFIISIPTESSYINNLKNE